MNLDINNLRNNQTAADFEQQALGELMKSYQKQVNISKFTFIQV